jgi:HEPN domain-containing protein
LSPSPEQIEYAEMLQRRAAGDLLVCRKLLDDTDIDDSIIGFHAQQCVEKALKVALVLADVELPRTHDLESLVEQVEEAGIKVPEELSSVDWLTPGRLGCATTSRLRLTARLPWRLLKAPPAGRARLMLDQ